jgi:hypothetical protein
MSRFDASREAELRAWLHRLDQPVLDPSSLRIAASDASPRRYWRLDDRTGSSWVVMDAPPCRQRSASPFSTSASA